MMPRQRIRETVLYFTPEKKEYEMKLKGVLVRMGIRIRVVAPEQTGETVGSLLGFAGWNADGQAVPDGKPTSKKAAPGVKAAAGETAADGESAEERAAVSGKPADGSPAEQVGKITDEVLVMHNFTGRRMDELFLNLRKAGVPRIPLKAVVTEINCQWSFYHLYEEIREEHEKMNQ